MARRVQTFLALLATTAFWTGCASSGRGSNLNASSGSRGISGIEHIRRLLDTGMQLQAQGRYAQSQQTLSNALSELSVVDTSGSALQAGALTQQVLGAMRSNLPYSLEPDNVDDPNEDEEDGVALLDSLSDTAALAPLDSATANSLRREAMADSTTTFDLPVEINDMVLMNLRIFKDQVPQHFARWLERKGRWEGMITQELALHGMPKDLVYLAMIESGFNPRATSPAAAAGIWQFIPGTGRRFGLRIDRFVDERRDPWKSTEAAIAYLGALYHQFGDWRLAMAAYNCGENCVDRSIRRSGVSDYWRIALPKETRNYVPRIFAAAILGKNPKAHGFDIHPWAPVIADTFTVEGGLSFSQISQALKVPEDSLGLLNPALVRGTTPPAHEDWVLNLPFGTRDRFSLAYASLDRSYQAPQPQKYVHRVRRKETLAGIASRYGVSVADLKRWNRISGKKARAGKTLVIWGDYPGGSGTALAEPPLAKRGEGIPQPSHQLSHKIRRGETLASISRTSGVSMADLQEWNGLSGSKLKPGHRIWISAPSEAERSAVAGLAHASVDSSRADVAGIPEVNRVASAKPLAPDHAFSHRVHHGETLERIAGRYGVSSEQIRKWNDLPSDRIKPGRRLWIGGDDPDPVVASVASRPVVSKGAVPRAAATRSGASPDGPAHVHVVRQGETLDAISHQYSVPATSIVFLNHLRNTRIDIGQKLIIPGQVAQVPAATTRVAAAVSPAKVRTVNYIVRLGDSLYSIARARATTVDTLMVINGLTQSKLKPGQVILVPLASAR